LRAGPPAVPREPLGALFLRFLRFGLLAWGGPVAQIAMIRQELVDEARWVSRERFNRVLAVYQALPGPEAHEMCVYFGYLARGRLGGLLAGLGFMLPGFLLMFTLSWLYATYGLRSPLLGAIFFGFQAAVLALIVRAVHRIGQHAVTDRWLAAVAGLAFVAQWLGVHFALTLGVAGGAALLRTRGRPGAAAALLALSAVVLGALAVGGLGPSGAPTAGAPEAGLAGGKPSLRGLLASGLRTGLLTFGGAYTAIPFLQRDAVEAGGWMTNAQFLDGIALGGILPAPLIIFSTFVGYLGGGPPGALVMTLGVFLPAFAFTLVGHEYVERVIGNKAVHGALDGIAAGVVGLIAATALDLLRAQATGWQALLIFALALGALYRWRAKTTVLYVVLGGGLAGLVLTHLTRVAAPGGS
jgi:chromate transporter